MDQVKVAIRSALLTNKKIVDLVGENIYPRHLSSLDNPVYPCVTISTISMETLVDQIGDNAIYQIDIWSKLGNDELWQIYNLIKEIINLKPLSNGVVFMRQISVCDDLYEKETRTFHLASKYKILTI